MKNENNLSVRSYIAKYPVQYESDLISHFLASKI